MTVESMMVSMEKDSVDTTLTKLQSIICCICKNNKNDKYIILSCDHIFHIQCLAEEQLNDIYNYEDIDVNYFTSRQCKQCNQKLQTEDLIHVHSKFLSSIKEKIDSHESSVENLENQLKKLKEELAICCDYKHKLLREKEKSKHMVTALMSIM